MTYETTYNFVQNTNCYVAITHLKRRFGFMPFCFFPIKEEVGEVFVQRPKTTWDEFIGDEEYALTINRKTDQFVTMIDAILCKIEEEN